jgi:4-methylaminobutanoate oxidase (formaldehyde-forming)
VASQRRRFIFQVNKIPSDFSFGEISPDWDRMTPYLEAAMSRVPQTLQAGAKKFFCGPESFAPDLAPIVGEAPEISNYFVAAGMNSIGILTGRPRLRVIACALFLEKFKQSNKLLSLSLPL